MKNLIPILQLCNFYCLHSEKPVFAPIDLQLDSGDIMHIRAANGGGKTTLLRALSGFAIAWEGQLFFCGKKIIPSQLRKHITFMNDRAGVFGYLTVYENLEYMLLLQGLQYTKKQYLDVLNKVGLHVYVNALANTISKGQKKRIHIARYILSKSPLWLLDEPFDGLDMQGKKLLADTIRCRCASNTSVMISSHLDISSMFGNQQTIHMIDLQTAAHTC